MEVEEEVWIGRGVKEIVKEMLRHLQKLYSLSIYYSKCCCFLLKIEEEGESPLHLRVKIFTYSSTTFI